MHRPDYKKLNNIKHQPCENETIKIKQYARITESFERIMFELNF